MQLETLSDWITFFASEDKIHETDTWTVLALSYDDQDSTLMFEQYNHRNPSAANPSKIRQFIISNQHNPNRLFANILFLSEHDFSLKKIIAGLENVSLQETGAALTGRLGKIPLSVMTYTVDK